jgi:hypothetical protein
VIDNANGFNVQRYHYSDWLWQFLRKCVLQQNVAVFNSKTLYPPFRITSVGSELYDILAVAMSVVPPSTRALISTRSYKMGVVVYKMEAFMSVRHQSGSEYSLLLVAVMQTQAVLAINAWHRERGLQ